MTIVSGTYCLPMGGKGTSGNLKIEVVSALPETGRVDRVYFVPIEGATGSNQYTEYIWDKDRQRFEEVGPREIDLTPYATKEALSAVDNRLVAAEAEIVAAKQNALSSGSAIKIEDNAVGVAVFDLPKFIIVGSPTITDDGIISGISSSNYVKTPPITVTEGSTVKICGRIITSSSFPSSSQTVFIFNDIDGSNSKRMFLSFKEDGRLETAVNNSARSTSQILDYNTVYDFECIFNGSNKITLKYKKANDTDFTTVSNDISDLLIATGNTFIGIYSNLGSPLTSCSLDLSKFSFTVDDEQVFSGTKTLYAALSEKQDVLTAGDNITIENGVISATGGGSGTGTVLTSADGATTYSELALGDTLAVMDGTLNANLDELGNEVNALASSVSTLESSVTGKQDKLTAISPLNIATKNITNINVVENISGGSLTSSFTYTLGSSMERVGYGLVTLPNKVINFSKAPSWEVVVKTRPSQDQKHKVYIPIVGSLIAGFQIGIFYGSGYYYIKQRISVDGSTWAFEKNSGLNNYTINYLKVSFNGTKYQFSCSADGITFNNMDSYTNSVTIKDSSLGLAYWNSSNNYYINPIYLTESYYIVDGVKTPFAESLGEVLAISTEPATTSSLGVVQPDGTSITVSDTGVISAVNPVQSETIRNIVVMTQAEYDALETKDATALYLIREETT